MEIDVPTILAALPTQKQKNDAARLILSIAHIVGPEPGVDLTVEDWFLEDPKIMALVQNGVTGYFSSFVSLGDNDLKNLKYWTEDALGN